MKTTINMFENLKTPKGAQVAVRKSFVLPLVVIIAAAAVGGTSLYFFMQGKRLDLKIAAQAQLLEQRNTDEVQQGQDAEVLVGQYGYYAQVGEEAEMMLRNMTKFDSGMYAQMESVKPSHVSITNLSMQEGKVTLNCTTTNNSPPAEYAAALDGLGLFESVEYSGFTGSAQTDYAFQISCVIPMQGGGAE